MVSNDPCYSSDANKTLALRVITYRHLKMSAQCLDSSVCLDNKHDDLEIDLASFFFKSSFNQYPLERLTAETLYHINKQTEIHQLDHNLILTKVLYPVAILTRSGVPKLL